MPADTLQSAQQKPHGGSQKRPLSQKLRTSCDNCHVAKVKCIPVGMQQGHCTRCHSHNVPCSYSPSLRVGKPRGSKNSKKQTVESAGPDDDLKQPSARSSRRESTVSSSHTVPEQFHREEEEMEDELPMNPGWEDEQTRLSMFSVPDFYGQQPMASMLPNLLASPSSTTISNFSPLDSLWPVWADQSHSNSAGTPESSEYGQTLHNFQGVLGNLGTGTRGSLDSSNTQEERTMIRPGYQQGTSSNNLQPRATRPSAQGRRAFDDEACPTAASKAQCDCIIPILQVLQHPLHRNRRREGKSIAETAAFDALLATNQRSIELCRTTLYCTSCFGSSTSFLLVPVLLNQILAVYMSACEVYLAGPNGTAAAAAAEGALSTIVPGSLRLTLGGYKITEEDECLLKKELVLIELRKVETLLSRYRHLNGTVKDRSEASTYEALLAYLTQRLQRTAQVIQPRR